MALNFDDDITSRIARQRKQQMAASMGKTVEQMDQDREYFDEIKAIEIEDKYVSDQEAAEEAAEMEEWGAYKPEKKGPQPESEAARNARLEGERQANVLRGGVVPEKRDTGSYTALDTARASVDPETLSDLAEDEASGRTAGIDNLSSSGPGAFKQRYADSETLSDFAEDEASGLRAGISNIGSSGPNAYNLRARMDSEALDDLGTDEASARTAGIDDLSASGPGMPSKKYTQNLGPKGTLDSEALSDLEEDEASERRGLMPIEDAEAQIDEMAAAGEQSDFQRDENDPAVKEFKQLNEKAVAGDPKALEDRAGIFKGMPKEEKAMAKEELGNYYIGPGGYAINLDKVDASRGRVVNMSMLQFVPDHAKSQMLASWGYIDQEDVDASPDDPKITVEEVKVAGALAVQKMVNVGANTVAQTNSDGTLRNTQELTRSREEIQKGLYQNNTDLATMNNAVKKEITSMNIDWNKVKLESDQVMHMDDNELKRWGIQFEGDMDMEQMHMLRDHFKKEMKFKYSKIRGIEKFQTAQLGQQNEQFKLSHGLKSTDQQQGWLVKQHTMMLQKASQLLENGNPTAAMMVYQAAGSDIEIDIPGYWKKQAKSSAFGNSAVSAAFGEMGFSTTNKNLNTGINGFVNEKKRIRKLYSSDTIDESTGMTKLDQWVKLNERNKNFSADPLGPAWSEMTPDQQEAYPGGRPAWKAVMVSKALGFEIGQGEYGNVARAMKSGKIKITKDNKTKNKTSDAPSKEEVKAKTVEKIKSPPEIAQEEGPGTQAEALLGSQKSTLPFKATSEDRAIERRQKEIIRSNKGNITKLTKEHEKAVKKLRVAEQGGTYSEEKLKDNTTLRVKYKRHKKMVRDAKQAIKEAKENLKKEESTLTQQINEIKARK